MCVCVCVCVSCYNKPFKPNFNREFLNACPAYWPQSPEGRNRKCQKSVVVARRDMEVPDDVEAVKSGRSKMRAVILSDDPDGLVDIAEKVSSPPHFQQCRA